MEHETPLSTNNDWIQTFTGRKFHFWGPDPDEIDVESLARGLAQTCRWRGQYKRSIPFYSVAQHCVYACEQAPGYAKKFALMHDAGEWPAGDMPKPMKASLPDYRKLEGVLLGKVCTRFKVPISDRVLKAVKIIDNWLLWEEGEQMLANPELMSEWQLARLDNPYAPARFKIRPWMPDEAEERFLKAYRSLWK